MMTKIKDLQNLIKLAKKDLQTLIKLAKTEEGPERVRTLKVAIKALNSLEKFEKKFGKMVAVEYSRKFWN